MAYLGNAPARSFISFERQVFTIVNSQTAYTLDHSVNNENDIRLVINNIVQEPGSGKAYTASGTTLTLSAALVNGTDEMYCVFLGRAVATNKPGAGSVGTSQLVDLNVTTGKIAADAITEAKIADAAVESEHLNNNVISGQTELAAEPADTDEFLVSDAGTLKRIDYSLIKGGGITNAQEFYVAASKSASSGTNTVLDMTWTETGGVIGSSSNVTVSSGIFSFATTGIYYIQASLSFYLIANRSSRYILGKIEGTTNNSSYSSIAQAYSQINSVTSSTDYASVFPSTILDVTDTSNVKFRLTMEADEELEIEYGSYSSSVKIIRLGDT